MKAIYIVQSGFQDGPEVFTTPKKAYDFIIQTVGGRLNVNGIPTYRKVLKNIKESIKNDDSLGWAQDEYEENSFSIIVRYINPTAYTSY